MKRDQGEVLGHREFVSAISQKSDPKSLEIQKIWAGRVSVILDGVKKQESVSKGGVFLEKGNKTTRVYDFPQQQGIEKTGNIPKKEREEEGFQKKPLYIPVPKDLNDTGKSSFLKKIRAKTSPAQLEDVWVKLMFSWLSVFAICAAVNIDATVFEALKWYKEWNYLSYTLKWDSSLFAGMSLKNIFEIIGGIPILATTIGSIVLKSQYYFNIGRYSKIAKDYKTNTLHYHIERNPIELQEWGYIGIIQELQKTLPEIVNELYGSKKIDEFDTITLDSYLLMNEGVRQKLKERLKRLFPYAEIEDLWKKPLNKNIKWALEVWQIRNGWSQYCKKRDTLIKKILSPVVCSRRTNNIVFTLATVQHSLSAMKYLGYVFSRFFSNSPEVSSKKEFTASCGFSIKLPKIRPND